jgi:hypothetical protein
LRYVGTGKDSDERSVETDRDARWNEEGGRDGLAVWKEEDRMQQWTQRLTTFIFIHRLQLLSPLFHTFSPLAYVTPRPFA